MIYIGAHINSNPNYLLESAKLVFETGGNLVQIFVDPLIVSTKKNNDYNEFIKFIKKNKMKIIVHASYTINLSRDWDQYSAGIQQFILEINAAYILGAA